MQNTIKYRYHSWLEAFPGLLDISPLMKWHTRLVRIIKEAERETG